MKLLFNFVANVSGVVLIGILLSSPAQAGESFSSRSLGKFVLDSSINLSTQLKTASVNSQKNSPVRPDSQPVKSSTNNSTSNRHDEYFEIYSAHVDLEGDFDGDGFYHALRVMFDADTNYDNSSVYAKLYLSRNGGRWNHYFTTDLFNIHGDSVLDEYEVMSELLEGYAPGYYDVLIELHSLHHVDVVASFVLENQLQRHPTALEDLSFDREGIVETETIVVSHGAGSFAWSDLLWLGLLGLLIHSRPLRLSRVL